MLRRHCRRFFLFEFLKLNVKKLLKKTLVLFLRMMLSGAMVNAAQHRQLMMRPDGRCYVLPNSNVSSGSEYDEQPVSRTYQYRKVSFCLPTSFYSLKIEASSYNRHKSIFIDSHILPDSFI